MAAVERRVDVSLARVAADTAAGNCASTPVKAEPVAYSAESINNQVHIDDCRGVSLEEQAQVVGAVLVACGAEALLQVTRIHMHYKLQHGERIVIRAKDERTLAKTPELLLDTATPTIAPISFFFGSDGSLFAAEYLDLATDAARGGKVADRIRTVLGNGKLWTSLREVMAVPSGDDGVPLAAKLGLQVVYDDALLPARREGDELHEDNWDRYQEMSLRPLDGRPTITTSWRFELDAAATEASGPRKVRCFCNTACSTWGGNGHQRGHSHDYVH